MKKSACRHPARFHQPISTARRGFTLIELMVVIAILVVLVSILAPAVRGAIELGRRAACGSNLRQMGLAHMKFASTQINKGLYLAGPANIDSSPIPSPECVWVNTAVPTGYSYKGYRSNGVLAYRRFISPEIMYCPSWDIETWLPGKKNKTAPIIGGWVPEDPTKPGTGILSDATLTAIVSTYFTRTTFIQPATTVKPAYLRPAQIGDDPGGQALMADAFWAPETEDGPKIFRTIHDREVGTVFLDNHVEMATPVDSSSLGGTIYDFTERVFTSLSKK